MIMPYYLITCIAACLFKYLDAQDVTSTSTESIFNNLKKAFSMLTNDSQLLEYIIPEMYASTMQQSSNLRLIFKIPNENTTTGYEILKMQRTDFAEPIFPNVSTNLVKDATKQQLSTKTQNEYNWNSFGLDGWSGQLAQPTPLVEQNHKDNYTATLKNNSYTGLLLNIKTRNFNGHVQGIQIEAGNSEPSDMTDLMNTENVYLARVNDPFGHSVKWKLKNATTIQEIERNKRDVIKLYSMIKCSTGCDPLVFKGYGCFCGFGGHGVPINGIDHCCKLHDKCYGLSNCISYLEYFVPYVWKCYHGKPLCAIDHGEWGGQNSCAARLCQCDLRLSRCLRKFQCPYRRAVCRSSRLRRLQNLIFFD